MSRKQRKSMLSFLQIAMLHIIKWDNQEEKRSQSWVRSINNSRKEMKDFQHDVPSISDDFIKENWNETFEKATKKAESEMNKPAKRTELSWDDVFKKEYLLIMFIIAALIYSFV